MRIRWAEHSWNQYGQSCCVGSGRRIDSDCLSSRGNDGLLLRSFLQKDRSHGRYFTATVLAFRRDVLVGLRAIDAVLISQLFEHY